jgi:ppGpp synthetase/RelA/SpoT-type nucleotidyltranferase
VTYTETDADRVCVLLKSIFKVDLKRSVDKGAQLKRNKVGYRSYHFICELDEQRLKLVEAIS